VQDSITITLPQPIKLGSLDFTELKLSEPTLGQLRKANREVHSLDQLAVLIHLNANLPPAVVDQLPQRIVDECSAFFGRFASDSQTTSETQSQK
jgi:hypothetical protein